MRHSIILAVIVGVLTCGVAHAGDVYKYVDERGQTLYTDKPMPGADQGRDHHAAAARQPLRAPTPRSRPPRTSSSPPATSASRRARTTRASPRTVAKDLEASRLERCKKARSDYNTSINSLRLYKRRQGWQSRLPDATPSCPSGASTRAKAVESICGPQG